MENGSTSGHEQSLLDVTIEVERVGAVILGNRIVEGVKTRGLRVSRHFE